MWRLIRSAIEVERDDKSYEKTLAYDISRGKKFNSQRERNFPFSAGFD